MAIPLQPPWDMPLEPHVSPCLKTSLVNDEQVLLDVDLCAGCFLCMCVCQPQVPLEDTWRNQL